MDSQFHKKASAPFITKGNGPSHELVWNEIRKRLPVTNLSRRLFHGRGHCFAGYEDLQIDWFMPVLLITLYRRYSEPWLEELIIGLRKDIDNLAAVYLQERFFGDSPTLLFWGSPPTGIEAIEAGLHYCLRLGEAQNIGFFLDMAVGRELVKRSAKQKKVLNLFAYSCSFSVAALAGSAEHVVNLDMNSGALALGRLNHELNSLDLRRTSFLALELFRSISKLRKLAPFDLIICDPPADQGTSFKAERDWPKLLRKLPSLITPGGEIIACLNAPHLPPEFLTQLFRELLPHAILLQSLQPGTDFPEHSAERGVWIFHYRLR